MLHPAYEVALYRRANASPLRGFFVRSDAYIFVLPAKRVIYAISVEEDRVALYKTRKPLQNFLLEVNAFGIRDTLEAIDYVPLRHSTPERIAVQIDYWMKKLERMFGVACRM